MHGNFRPLSPLMLVVAIIFTIPVFCQTAQTSAENSGTRTALAEPSPSPSPSPEVVPRPSPTPSLEKNFFINVIRDQKAIWTSPFHLGHQDARWMAPLGLSIATLMFTDHYTARELVEDSNSTRLRYSRAVSRIGEVYTTAGVAAGFYLIGRAKKNDRAKETGLLAAEALLDSGIVVEVLKTASRRARPPADNTSGEFFDHGTSFPSGHAISIWSVATVISEEYGQQRPLLRFGLYGIATAVSMSRFTGTNHFLSDILVGSALGYGIGRFVYHTHHNIALDGTTKKRSKLIPDIGASYTGRSYGGTLAWTF